MPSQTGGPSGSWRDGPWPRRLGVGLLVVVAVLGVVATLSVPSVGLADRGDWGTVTDDRTEVVTTVWVNNPNPVGVALGDGLTADYDVSMNGVSLAEGSASGLTLPAGNSTHRLRTDLTNERLPAWWVAFVRANETVELRVDATLRADAVLTARRDVQVERTVLDEETPVIDALSASVDGTSGTYTRTVSADRLDDSLTDRLGIGGAEATVGYEVERGWATWESVTEEETTVLLNARVHNPGDVPVPAAPDGLAVSIDTNDVRLFEGRGEDLSLRSVGPDAVIQPGETRVVTVAVTMDNEQVDEWFTSHVRADAGPGTEATTVEAGFRLVFENPVTGDTVRLPRDGPATYDCQFGTEILVDDQPVETTCGDVSLP